MLLEILERKQQKLRIVIFLNCFQRPIYLSTLSWLAAYFKYNFVIPLNYNVNYFSCWSKCLKQSHEFSYNDVYLPWIIYLGSRKIAPEENCPSALILTLMLNQILTLTGGQFSSGIIFRTPFIYNVTHYLLQKLTI